MSNRLSCLRWLLVICLLIVLAAVAKEPPTSTGFVEPVRRADAKPLAVSEFTAPVLVPRVLRTLPHDPECYTQGLTISSDGRCFESNGGYNRSDVREVELSTGKVLRRHSLPIDWWAEGLTWSGNGLLLLTWQNRLMAQFSPSTLEPVRLKRWDREGWGVTVSDSSLVVSDGTDRLFYLDPDTWEVRHQLTVRDGNTPIDLLNELETVGPFLWANVWLSDYIAIVHPQTGQIEAWLDCRKLLTPEEQRKTDLLNGIAYDTSTSEIYLTGKMWPKTFVIAIPKLPD